MKVHQLISALQKLDEYADIAIWNSCVGDYQYVEEVSTTTLVRQSFEDYCFRFLCERIRDTGNRGYELTSEEIEEMREHYKPYDWQVNPYVTDEAIAAGRWEELELPIIVPRPRFEVSYGRGGNVEY